MRQAKSKSIREMFVLIGVKNANLEKRPYPIMRYAAFLLPETYCSFFSRYLLLIVLKDAFSWKPVRGFTTVASAG